MLRRNSHAIDELELMAYLDGELPRERAAAAAAHLETCRECQTIVSDLRNVSQELAAWQVEPTDLNIDSHVLAALEEHQRAQESVVKKNRSRGLSFIRRHRILMLGAVPVVTIILAIATLQFFHGNPAAPSVMRYYSQPSTSRDKVVQRSSTTAPGDRYVDGRVANSSAEFSYDPGGLTSRLQKDEQAYGNASQTAQSNEEAKGRKAQGINIPAGPMVIRTAELALTAQDFDQTRSKLEDILKRHHGYLGELTVSGAADAARTLSATVRVPADQLDVTIAELKKLGHVDSESQKGEEVSQQYVDLQARLANARTTEQTLLDILRHRTGKLSDVLAVEQEVASIREKIERMEAEKKSLEKQVAFSTLNMRVAEDYKQQVHVVPESTSRRIRNAAVDGYETMVAGLINVLLFLVSAGPSVLLWAAILFFPARFAWKKWRSRNRI